MDFLVLWVTCIQLHKGHVLKRRSLIPMHALFTIHVHVDHGTGIGQHFRGRLESHDFSKPGIPIFLKLAISLSGSICRLDLSCARV